LHVQSEVDIEQRLAELKVEKARRLRDEMMHFYKAYGAQADLHTSQADIRALSGGNQVGKTLAGSMEMAWTVGGVHPYRKNYYGRVAGRDCCVDFGHVMGVLLPTYRKILPRGECTLAGKTFEGKPRVWPGLKHGDFDKAYNVDRKILTLANGSYIEFKSYDQGWRRFQGAQCHIIRMDEEPDSWGEQIYNENRARQLTLGINLLFTLTPLNYSQWLFDEIYEGAARSDNIEVFECSVYDSRYIDAEVIKAIEAIKDPAEREARLFGRPTYRAGLVYKEYGSHNLVDHYAVPGHWKRTIIIDPHIEKATAVNWVATDEETGKSVVYREGDLRGTVQQISEEIRSMSEDEYISVILMDPSARAKNTIDGRGALVDEFRKHLHGVILANNAVDKGINLVRQYVANNAGGPILSVMKSCPVTHSQMKSYSWKPPTPTGEDRSKPTVVKKNDDHCDNIRYWAMHNPRVGTQSFGGFGMEVYANG